MELIELKTAIDAAKGKSEHTDIVFDKATESEIVYMLRSLPTVDAVPVVHGKWIFGETLGHSWMKCSCCCKSQFGQTLTFSYCPNCGALMDGKAE